MPSKALFFDIDGTLIDSKGQIPPSAKESIEKARENGAYVFINSGRCMGMLEFLKPMLKIDGFVAGCGTDIYINDEQIHYYLMSDEDKEEMIKASERCNIELILEGKYGVYYHTDVEDSRFRVMKDVKSVTTKSGCKFYGHDDYVIASKFCLQADEQSDLKSFVDEFKDRYDILDRHHGFYEASPVGMNKGTGIELVIEKLGISKADTYVFGDSTNDLAMFQCGATNIAMGKHDKELEEYADYITDDLENDGIKNALIHYGLIR